ncbi:MAG TPA: DUF1579 domain-containing protein [Phycisphaerales bacterium]|nr:DUF1579 domain-containing protein [Phycisphaerales bacterium]
MKSIGKTLILSAALLTAGIGVGMAMAQHDHDSKWSQNGGMQTVDPMTQKYMDAWKAYAMPTENHKALDWKVGTWTGKVNMWMMPQQPEPETSECSVTTSWVMDHRYLQSTVEGQFNGETFQGLGVEGYDNFQKKYVGTWIDNMGTGIMSMEGQWDSSKNTMTTTGEGPNFWTGKMVKSHGTVTKISNNSYKEEMYAPGPDGKEFKCMEITYTRTN